MRRLYSRSFKLQATTDGWALCLASKTTQGNGLALLFDTQEGKGLHCCHTHQLNPCISHCCSDAGGKVRAGSSARSAVCMANGSPVVSWSPQAHNTMPRLQTARETSSMSLWRLLHTMITTFNAIAPRLQCTFHLGMLSAWSSLGQHHQVLVCSGVQPNSRQSCCF